ncbi:uncharacterized protein LOC143448925 isoform X4 [Clavelina lepadiformis]|uniref:uncharacterized protein LOC143448925 isoform X4 n=1 Tax=Clavelina lepadiformis TaxID=159417 RepID=UPI004042A636
MKETRHLWVGNLPENVREDKITDIFKKYGRVEKVRILPKRSSSESQCAVVAFVDIRSAQKAQNSTNNLGDLKLETSYSEQAAMSSGRQKEFSPRHGSSVGHRNHASGYRAELSRSADGGERQYTSDRYRSTAAAPTEHPDSKGRMSKDQRGECESGSGSGHSSSKAERKSKPDQAKIFKKKSKKPTDESKQIKKGKVSKSKERGRSPTVRRESSNKKNSHTSSESDASSSYSSGTSSNSSASSTGSSSRSISSSSSSSSGTSAEIEHDDDQQKLVTMIIKKLPTRPSVNSLREGIYHEFKKCGKVKSVVIRGDNNNRHALVLFRNAAEAMKSVSHTKTKLLFGAAIEASIYEGEVSGKELQECGGIIDEFHPRASRTLFVGNLDKTVGYSDIQNIFVRFGEIVAIEIKKQNSIPQYAFLQYTDIASVVKAIQKMDGEKLGKNTLKLGFGKTVMSSCIWVEGVTDSFTENYLASCFQKFGPVEHVVIDRSRGQALIFYLKYEQAQQAVTNMKGRKMNGSRLKLDYASQELIELFLTHMRSSGQSVMTFESIRHLLLPAPSAPGVPPPNPPSSGSRSSRSGSSHPYSAGDGYYDDVHHSRYPHGPPGYDVGAPPRGDWRWEDRNRGRPMYQGVSPRGRRYEDERGDYYRRDGNFYDRVPGGHGYDPDYRGQDYARREHGRDYAPPPRGYEDYHRMKSRDRRDPPHHSRPEHSPPPRPLPRRSRSLSPRSSSSSGRGRVRDLDPKLEGRMRERDHPAPYTRSPARSPGSRDGRGSGTDPWMRRYRDQTSRHSSPSHHSRDDRCVEMRDSKPYPGSPRSGVRSKGAGESGKSSASWVGSESKQNPDYPTSWSHSQAHYDRSRSETPTRDENLDSIGEVIIKQPVTSQSALSKDGAERKSSKREASKSKSKNNSHASNGNSEDHGSNKPEKTKDSRDHLLQRVHSSSPSGDGSKSKIKHQQSTSYKSQSKGPSSSSSDCDDNKSTKKQKLHHSKSKQLDKAHGPSKLIKREFSPSSCHTECDVIKSETEAVESAKSSHQKKRRFSDRAKETDADKSTPSRTDEHWSSGGMGQAAKCSENSPDEGHPKASKRARRATVKHEAPLSIASQCFMDNENNDDENEAVDEEREPSTQFRSRVIVKEEIIEVMPDADMSNSPLEGVCEQIEVEVVEDIEELKDVKRKSRWEPEVKAPKTTPTVAIAQPFHTGYRPYESLIPTETSAEVEVTSSSVKQESSEPKKEKLSQLEQEKERLERLLHKLDTDTKLGEDEANQVADVVIKEMASKMKIKIQEKKEADSSLSSIQQEENVIVPVEIAKQDESLHQIEEDITFSEDQAQYPEVVETIVEEEVTAEEIFTDTDFPQLPVVEDPPTSEVNPINVDVGRDYVKDDSSEKEKRRREKEQRSLIRKKLKEQERHKRKVEQMRGPSQKIVSSLLDEEESDPNVESLSQEHPIEYLDEVVLEEMTSSQTEVESEETIYEEESDLVDSSDQKSGGEKLLDSTYHQQLEEVQSEAMSLSHALGDVGPVLKSSSSQISEQDTKMQGNILHSHEVPASENKMLGESPAVSDASTPHQKSNESETTVIVKTEDHIKPPSYKTPNKTPVAISPYTPKSTSSVGKLSRTSRNSNSSRTNTPSPSVTHSHGNHCGKRSNSTSSRNERGPSSHDRRALNKAAEHKRKKAEQMKQSAKFASQGQQEKAIPHNSFTNLTVSTASPSEPLGKKELETLRAELETMKQQLNIETSPGFLSPSSDNESSVFPVSPILKSPLQASTSIDVASDNSKSSRQSITSPLFTSSPSIVTSPAIHTSPAMNNTSNFTEKLKSLGKVKKRAKVEESGAGAGRMTVEKKMTMEDKNLDFRTSRLLRSSIFDQDSARLSHLQNPLNQSLSAAPVLSSPLFSSFIDPNDLPADRPLFSSFAEKASNTEPVCAPFVAPLKQANGNVENAAKNECPLSSSTAGPAPAESEASDIAGQPDDATSQTVSAGCERSHPEPPRMSAEASNDQDFSSGNDSQMSQTTTENVDVILSNNVVGASDIALTETVTYDVTNDDIGATDDVTIEPSDDVISLQSIEVEDKFTEVVANSDEGYCNVKAEDHKSSDVYDDVTIEQNQSGFPGNENLASGVTKESIEYSQDNVVDDYQADVVVHHEDIVHSEEVFTMDTHDDIIIEAPDVVANEIVGEEFVESHDVDRVQEKVGSDVDKLPDDPTSQSGSADVFDGSAAKTTALRGSGASPALIASKNNEPKTRKKLNDEPTNDKQPPALEQSSHTTKSAASDVKMDPLVELELDRPQPPDTSLVSSVQLNASEHSGKEEVPKSEKKQKTDKTEKSKKEMKLHKRSHSSKEGFPKSDQKSDKSHSKSSEAQPKCSKNLEKGGARKAEKSGMKPDRHKHKTEISLKSSNDLHKTKTLETKADLGFSKSEKSILKTEGMKPDDKTGGMKPDDKTGGKSGSKVHKSEKLLLSNPHSGKSHERSDKPKQLDDCAKTSDKKSEQQISEKKMKSLFRDGGKRKDPKQHKIYKEDKDGRSSVSKKAAPCEGNFEKQRTLHSKSLVKKSSSKQGREVESDKRKDTTSATKSSDKMRLVTKHKHPKTSTDGEHPVKKKLRLEDSRETPSKLSSRVKGDARRSSSEDNDSEIDLFSKKIVSQSSKLKHKSKPKPSKSDDTDFGQKEHKHLKNDRGKTEIPEKLKPTKEVSRFHPSDDSDSSDNFDSFISQMNQSTKKKHSPMRSSYRQEIYTSSDSSDVSDIEEFFNKQKQETKKPEKTQKLVKSESKYDSDKSDRSLKKKTSSSQDQSKSKSQKKKLKPHKEKSSDLPSSRFSKSSQPSTDKHKEKKLTKTASMTRGSDFESRSSVEKVSRSSSVKKSSRLPYGSDSDCFDESSKLKEKKQYSDPTSKKLSLMKKSRSIPEPSSKERKTKLKEEFRSSKHHKKQEEKREKFRSSFEESSSFSSSPDYPPPSPPSTFLKVETIRDETVIPPEYLDQFSSMQRSESMEVKTVVGGQKSLKRSDEIYSSMSSSGSESDFGGRKFGKLSAEEIKILRSSSSSSSDEFSDYSEDYSLKKPHLDKIKPQSDEPSLKSAKSFDATKDISSSKMKQDLSKNVPKPSKLSTKPSDHKRESIKSSKHAFDEKKKAAHESKTIKSSEIKAKKKVIEKSHPSSSKSKYSQEAIKLTKKQKSSQDMMEVPNKSDEKHVSEKNRSEDIQQKKLSTQKMKSDKGEHRTLESGASLVERQNEKLPRHSNQELGKSAHQSVEKDRQHKELIHSSKKPQLKTKVKEESLHKYDSKEGKLHHVKSMLGSLKQRKLQKIKSSSREDLRLSDQKSSMKLPTEKVLKKKSPKPEVTPAVEETKADNLVLPTVKEDDSLKSVKEESMPGKSFFSSDSSDNDHDDKKKGVPKPKPSLHPWTKAFGQPGQTSKDTTKSKQITSTPLSRSPSKLTTPTAKSSHQKSLFSPNPHNDDLEESGDYLVPGRGSKSTQKNVTKYDDCVETREESQNLPGMQARAPKTSTQSRSDSTGKLEERNQNESKTDEQVVKTKKPDRGRSNSRDGSPAERANRLSSYERYQLEQERHLKEIKRLKQLSQQRDEEAVRSIMSSDENQDFLSSPSPFDYFGNISSNVPAASGNTPESVKEIFKQTSPVHTESNQPSVEQKDDFSNQEEDSKDAGSLEPRSTAEEIELAAAVSSIEFDFGGFKAQESTSSDSYSGPKFSRNAVKPEKSSLSVEQNKNLNKADEEAALAASALLKDTHEDDDLTPILPSVRYVEEETRKSTITLSDEFKSAQLEDVSNTSKDVGKLLHPTPVSQSPKELLASFAKQKTQQPSSDVGQQLDTKHQDNIQQTSGKVKAAGSYKPTASDLPKMEPSGPQVESVLCKPLGHPHDGKSERETIVSSSLAASSPSQASQRTPRDSMDISNSEQVLVKPDSSAHMSAVMTSQIVTSTAQTESQFDNGRQMQEKRRNLPSSGEKETHLDHLTPSAHTAPDQPTTGKHEPRTLHPAPVPHGVNPLAPVSHIPTPKTMNPPIEKKSKSASEKPSSTQKGLEPGVATSIQSSTVTAASNLTPPIRTFVTLPSLAPSEATTGSDTTETKHHPPTVGVHADLPKLIPTKRRQSREVFTQSGHTAEPANPTPGGVHVRMAEDLGHGSRTNPAIHPPSMPFGLRGEGYPMPGFQYPSRVPVLPQSPQLANTNFIFSHMPDTNPQHAFLSSTNPAIFRVPSPQLTPSITQGQGVVQRLPASPLTSPTITAASTNSTMHQQAFIIREAQALTHLPHPVGPSTSNQLPGAWSTHHTGAVGYSPGQPPLKPTGLPSRFSSPLVTRASASPQAPHPLTVHGGQPQFVQKNPVEQSAPAQVSSFSPIPTTVRQGPTKQSEPPANSRPRSVVTTTSQPLSSAPLAPHIQVPATVGYIPPGFPQIPGHQFSPHDGKKQIPSLQNPSMSEPGIPQQINPAYSQFLSRVPPMLSYGFPTIRGFPQAPYSFMGGMPIQIPPNFTPQGPRQSMQAGHMLSRPPFTDLHPHIPTSQPPITHPKVEKPRAQTKERTNPHGYPTHPMHGTQPAVEQQSNVHQRLPDTRTQYITHGGDHPVRTPTSIAADAPMDLVAQHFERSGVPIPSRSSMHPSSVTMPTTASGGVVRHAMPGLQQQPYRPDMGPLGASSQGPGLNTGVFPRGVRQPTSHLPLEAYQRPPTPTRGHPRYHSPSPHVSWHEPPSVPQQVPAKPDPQIPPPDPYHQAPKQTSQPQELKQQQMEPGPQDSLDDLFQRYPVIWQGRLALKNDCAAVQVHYVCGNILYGQAGFPKQAASSDTNGLAELRIIQRMKNLPPQIEGLRKRMMCDQEFCLLVALPCGRDKDDVVRQTNALNSGFISYLRQKEVAGIVNVDAAIDQTQQKVPFVLHIFPPCDFATDNLQRRAPDLLSNVGDIQHLTIVITTA